MISIVQNEMRIVYEMIYSTIFFIIFIFSNFIFVIELRYVIYNIDIIWIIIFIDWSLHSIAIATFFLKYIIILFSEMMFNVRKNIENQGHYGKGDHKINYRINWHYAFIKCSVLYSSTDHIICITEFLILSTK